MWALLGDLKNVVGSRRFWSGTVRLTILVSAGLAVLLVAMSAMILLFPLALAAGFALHLYVRRALRQTSRHPRNDVVIEGEYVILEPR